MDIVELADGVVAIDPAGRHLFLYNQTAAYALLAWRAGQSADRIATDLSEATGLSRDVAAASVVALLTDWTERARGEPALAPDPVPVHEASPTSSARPKRYRIGGRRFRLRIDGEPTRTHVAATLAPFLLRGPGDAGSEAETAIDLAVAAGPVSHVLRVDGVERLRVGTAPEATGAVFQQLLQAIRPDIAWLALIHGAAVVAPGGRAVVLAGAGGSGKSTLAAFLARQGYGFLTDDMVALRAPDGAVVSWPLPHSLKRGSWTSLAPLYPELADAPVARIHGRDVRFVAARAEDWARTPTAVAAIVFPRFAPGTDDGIEPVTPFEALRRLIEDRLWLGETLTVARVEAFVGWLRTVPAFAIRYASSAGAERLIRSAFG